MHLVIALDYKPYSNDEEDRDGVDNVNTLLVVIIRYVNGYKRV